MTSEQMETSLQLKQDKNQTPLCLVFTSEPTMKCWFCSRRPLDPGALPVHGRGDAFQAEEMQENDLDETTSPSDDILDINRELILLEAPESSVLVEGDIVKVSPFRTFPSADVRWPKKRGIVQIPYIISYKYDKSSVKKIKEAFQDLEKFTCIKFVPYSYQRDFILIAPLSGCFSSVGRTGGVQVVSLAAACLGKGKGVALHELMHVLGFWHEHSRADRDKYISISWNEILTGFETNFMKTWNPNMLVDYDYSSIMHYGRNAFSMTGLPTIVPLSGSCTVIGRSWNLSSSDIARVNKLYRCSRVAAQPEAETEGAIEGTMVEFAPSESEPCPPKSKAGVSTTWRPSPIAAEASHSAGETLQQLGTTLLSSRAVEEGSSATEVSARRTAAAPEAEEHDWHVVSRKTPSKAEVDGKGLMVAEGMPHRTQPTEVAAESTALKASELQTEQKVGSSTNQPPHYKEDHTPSGQNATETTTRQAATEVALAPSPLLTSPAPLTTVGAKGTERRPTESVLHQLLSGTRPMHGEQTEPSACVEVGSSELEDDDGSPSPAEEHPFSVMENATKEEEDLFHTTVSRAGGKVGDSAHTHLTRVWAKAISSPYMRHSPKDPGNPVVTTDIGGPFSPTGSEAGSQTDITIDHYSRMVDTGMERLPESEMPYTQSGSRRASAASESVLWATSGEAPALESSYGDLYRSRPTAGAQSPWGNFIGHLAASRLNKVMENHPTDHSKEVEQSSLPPAHLAREGELFTLLSQGSALPTERITLEKWASVHVALPTQAPTLRELASLAPETNRVTHPTKGSSLPGVSWSQSPRPTELRHMASWGQPSRTKGYGSSTLVSRQAPSVGVHSGELLHPALEAVSLATLERPSLGQKASLGLGHEEEPGGQAHLGTELPEEAKTDGRASLWRMLSTVSSGTQMSPKLGCGVAENQWQQSSSPSVGTSATGASPSGLQTKDLTGLRTVVSALSWRGGMTGSPYVAQTAEGSPGLQLKPVVIKGMSPGAETKGHGSLLKETFLPVTETSLSSGWVSLSGSLREDNGTDRYTEPLEDASSAAKSELAKLLKGTPGSAVAGKERTAEMTHVGSTALSLRGPTSQGVQESPNSLPVGGTESPTNSWSPSVQFLDQTSGRNAYSQPEKARRFAEGRLAEPADIAEEMAQEGMNWATTHAVNATLERRGLASPLLGVGSTALKSGAVTRGTDLPRTAGSPESPRLALDSEGLAASRPPGTVLPPAILPVDGAAASSQAYIASAIPLEAWEDQTTAATDATAALSGVSSKSWEPSVGPAAVGTQPLTEIRRLASPGAAILGHTATKHAVVGSLQLQTEMLHLEETTWSTAETKGVAKVMKFLFEEGKTPTMKSGVQVSRDTAVYTPLGSKRSAVNSTEIPETASMDVRPFLPRNTKEWDKPTAATGKEGATYNSVSPTSKLPLETIGSLGPGNGRTSEMALSVFGAVNSSSGEKLLPSENRNPFPVEPSEGAAASTVGISPVHPQTLGSAEIGTSTAFYQVHATQGRHSYSELLLSKLTPEGMGDRKHLFPPVEESKQAFEAQIVRLDEEMTSRSKEVELQQNGTQSIDRHNIRRIRKQSLPEMVPSPSPAYVLPKERHRDCELCFP